MSLLPKRNFEQANEEMGRRIMQWYWMMASVEGLYTGFRQLLSLHTYRCIVEIRGIRLVNSPLSSMYWHLGVPELRLRVPS